MLNNDISGPWSMLNFACDCHISWSYQCVVSLPACDRFEMLASTTKSDGVRLMDYLRQFQMEGIKFALSRGGRVLIADEMGLGKTIQSISLLKCYQDEWPALIVCPSSLRSAWVEQLKEVSGQISALLDCRHAFASCEVATSVLSCPAQITHSRGPVSSTIDALR